MAMHDHRIVVDNENMAQTFCPRLQPSVSTIQMIEAWVTPFSSGWIEW
jgi:hypothetical protein